jgi:flagellar motor switch/type III secretory pathway protein FliN
MTEVAQDQAEDTAAAVEELATDVPLGIDHQAIANAEVTVRFSIGSARTTLGELTSIQPGYVFETETKAAVPVTIEFNGVALGKGELVSIGDRLGVLVQEYHGHE